MKVSVKETDKCQKQLQIEVPKETIREEFNNYYNSIKNSAQVPGFRKGKAPRHILEQHFADKAHEQVLTDLINKAYRRAIEEEKIKAVTYPQVSDISFKEGEKLSFTALVAVKPEFSLKEYKGIKIKKRPLELKDEEINKVLTYLQERYAQFLPVENRASKIGDYVICDYNYSVGDKILEKKDHVWLWIDEKLFIPGISKELEGIKAGEKKEFDAKLPEHFIPKEVANKTAHFNFLIKEIKEKKLPALDDEFANMVGKQSLSELKELIKSDLLKEKEVNAKLDVKNQIFDALMKHMPIEVPASMVKEREQLLRESARNRLKQQGLNESQIKDEEKQLDDFFPKEALKQIRLFFILQEIADKENLKIGKGDMDKRIDAMAESYNQKREDILKYLNEKNMLENLHWELWEEKIINFLTEHANIEQETEKKK